MRKKLQTRQHTCHTAPWHVWFAWFPVKTEDGYIVFLEIVWRNWNEFKYSRMDETTARSYDVGGWDYLTDRKKRRKIR